MTRIGRAMKGSNESILFVASGRIAGNTVGYPAGVTLNIFSHKDILIYTKAPEYGNWIYTGFYAVSEFGEGTQVKIPREWAAEHIGKEMLIKVSFTKHGIFLSPFRQGSLDQLFNPEPHVESVDLDPAVEILELLNTERKRHFPRSRGFNTADKNNLKGIRARLKEYRQEELKAVILYKSRDWKGTSMIKYLDPETLFRPSKFAKYLGSIEDSTLARENTTPELMG